MEVHKQYILRSKKTVGHPKNKNPDTLPKNIAYIPSKNISDICSKTVYDIITKKAEFYIPSTSRPKQ